MQATAVFEQLFSIPLRNGVSYPAATRGEGVQMVNMKEIFAYDRISDQECELVPLTPSEKNVYTLEAGDLLFARQSLTYEGAGKCVIVLPVNHLRTWESHLIRVRLDPSLTCPAYYFYYFKSPAGRRSIESIVQQVAAAGIRGSDLRRLLVPFPTLLEQQGIAEALVALDDKIAANTRLIEIERKVAHSLYQLGLSSSEPSRQLVSDMTNQLARGITPEYTNAEDGVMVLNQKCIRDQTVDIDASRQTESTRTRAEKMLVINDVLVNSTGQGTLGRTARWTNPCRATVDSHITLVRFDPELIDPVIAGYAMLALQSDIEALGEGSTGQTELARTELGKLVLAVPNRGLQSELSCRLVELDRLEHSHRQENSVLARLRDALLPQLMSGKLRVKDAEKQVEEVV